MKTTHAVTVGAIALAMAASTASAQLTLEVDPNTQTFSLTGSDSGVPATDGSFFSGLDFTNLTVGDILAAGSGSPLAEDTDFTDGNAESIFSAGFSSLDNGALVLSFGWFALINDATITGLGTDVSYAGFSAANIATLEGADGVLLNPVNSFEGFGNETPPSGFGSVTISVIPAPGAAAVLGLSGLALVRRRR